MGMVQLLLVLSSHAAEPTPFVTLTTLRTDVNAETTQKALRL